MYNSCIISILAVYSDRSHKITNGNGRKIEPCGTPRNIEQITLVNHISVATKLCPKKKPFKK